MSRGVEKEKEGRRAQKRQERKKGWRGENKVEKVGKKESKCGRKGEGRKEKREGLKKKPSVFSMGAANTGLSVLFAGGLHEIFGDHQTSRLFESLCHQEMVSLDATPSHDFFLNAVAPQATETWACRTPRCSTTSWSCAARRTTARSSACTGAAARSTRPSCHRASARLSTASASPSRWRTTRGLRPPRSTSKDLFMLFDLDQ